MIALLVAAGMNLFAYWNADKLVLSMHGAQEVDERDRARTRAAGARPGAARRPADAARLPHGQPAAERVRDRPQPASTRRSRRPPASSTCSARDEIAGVIAHELAHIKNRDTLTMTITATIAGAISMLAQFGLFFGGGHRDNKQRPRHHRHHRDGDPRADRRHAGADGDQPHARIRRRRAGRAHLRPAGCARLGARQDRRRRPADRECQRPSAIRRPRICSSSIR